MLINRVVPTPCCIKTATGGNKRFNIMVRSDILFYFN